MELEYIIQSLQKAFEDENVKKAVLDDNWYQLNKKSGIHSTGFCFASAEVIFRLAGGRKTWMVKRILDPKDWNYGSHYYIQHKESGDILDITSNQYEEREIEIPYHLGKGTGLRNISNKAKILAKMAGLGELKTY